MTDIIKLRGFKNLGNTCYMNSAIQALLSSNILNNALLLYIRRNPECINSLSPLLIEYCMILMDHINIKNLNPCDLTSVYSPTRFKDVLGKSVPMFVGYQQHDSHELIINMFTEFVEKTKIKGII